MSQNPNRDAVITEQLHCSICDGYLSCAPVRVLPNGTFICGQCSPSNNDSPIYRVQALEAILENVSFPCRFAQHGCAERLVFGQTAKHELKCEYRSFACPSQRKACCWEGSTLQMLNHFTEAHPEQVVQNADFKFQLDKNAGGVILVPKKNALFVIKYQYKADNNHLTYDIRFCKNNSVCGASYKLQFINDSDPEYNINLKTTDCMIYDDSFGIRNVSLLNLNKFLEVLDNPNCILISINLEIRHINVASGNKIDFEINRELLNTLKCSKCFNYLVAPLFCLDENIICCDCAKTNKNYLPHNDRKLLQRLNETNFPCRWRNCKFIMKNNYLKKHELECQFRQYNCFIQKLCKGTFTLTSAINHYKMHNYQYKDKELSFTTSLPESHGGRRIFTIKQHTIIALWYSVSITNNSRKIELLLSTSDAELTTGSINFEHQHCKIKSKSFEIISGKFLKIIFDELPTCFIEEDELTGAFTESNFKYLCK